MMAILRTVPAKRLEVSIDDRRLSLSNLDKLLYPQAGFTKGHVIDYYTRIAPVLLPHLRDRPLTLKRYPDSETPTLIAFDLDPGAPATIVECARVALELREAFDHLGLETFPKTSGSKGMQVYLPLNTPGITFDDTKTFAMHLAQLLERRDRELVVSEMAKAKRPGKVFVDWSQNDRHKTTVNVYSLRAMPFPTVSTPLTWDEVSDALDAGDPSA